MLHSLKRNNTHTALNLLNHMITLRGIPGRQNLISEDSYILGNPSEFSILYHLAVNLFHILNLKEIQCHLKIGHCHLQSHTSDLKVGGNTLINDLPTYIFSAFVAVTFGVHIIHNTYSVLERLLECTDNSNLH